MAVKSVTEQAEEEKKAAVEEICRSLNIENQQQLQDKEREFNNHLAALQGQLSVS